MKSSEKVNANFGLVKRMYNGLKHWYSKAKLFFIRSVAHSKSSDMLVDKYPEESFIYGVKMIYRDWDVAKDCLLIGLKLKYAIPLLALYFLSIIAVLVQFVYYSLYR